MSTQETLEETKKVASGEQRLTLAGRITTGLSPVAIDPDTAQFWIMEPEALNARVANFARKPTIVQVFGYRCGPARGLASLINAWFAKELDIYALDVILYERQSDHKGQVNTWTGRDIHPLADIVVVDTPELYLTVTKVLKDSGRAEKTVLMYVNSDPEQMPVVTGTLLAHKNNAEALKAIAERQLQIIRSFPSDRFPQLKRFLETRE